MSNFGRHDNGGHESYLIDQQIALPLPYSHSESHPFGPGGSYHLSQPALHSYMAQFGPTYAQQSISPSIQHLASHYPTGPSFPPTPDQAGLQHQSSQCINQPHYLQSAAYLPLREAHSETEIENQESKNERTMLSEAIVPAPEGFPNAEEFDRLINGYIHDLSAKKRDKALIHAQRAGHIKMILSDPKNTAVETAQFRFWAKKMFELRTTGVGSSNCMKMICHEGRPVAVREKLYKILTKAHLQCKHGGRDKTSAKVRTNYSWVPKELISRFVKICPTCQVRRRGLRPRPSGSQKRPSHRSSKTKKSSSPPTSRRESALNSQAPSQVSQAEYLGQLDDNHDWMDSQQNIHERQGINQGSVETLSHFPNSISATLDPFGGEMVMSPSQLNYSVGYASGILKS
ncbi:integrase zinc binding domain-containing protein [Aspergillus ruber CBS 135680]|uniref:Integrase zinc-binding domain-containing protein n=1 Tax=Aspergillus ruber (strain CBS 135680) TaxID=1388766 RepID=A0A017SFV2_ASPRC|nr:uncharacterized protein EURHEDRAFT_477230 [Aspergillus ruber CBS 135680]EYE95888.1 hypothetical protein EURHEDRAFT_477230 [Aspergillus ruber CBS 135680]